MKNIFASAATALLLLACNNKSNDAAISEINSNTQDLKKQEYKAENIPAPPPPMQSPNQVEREKSEGLIAVADTSSSNNISITVLQSGGPGTVTDWDKKLIKTANLTLELKNYNAFNSSIHTKLKTYGAYTAQENQTETEDKIENNLSIKVPVDKFEDLLNSIQGDGIKILEKNISTEDVTGEVADTKARLEAKKEVRLKYLELLKQAKNMNDILQVQSEINSIQEDIESADSRVNYLMHQSSFSTINIKYFQYLNGVTAKDAAPGFFTKLTDAFYGGTSFLANIIVFLISLWPLITGAIIVYFFARKIHFKKAKA